MESIITLSISSDVTQEEWTPVYEEALSLAEHFPLAELRYRDINQVIIKCLVKSKEREYTQDWGDSETGLRIECDSVTKSTCEPFFMKKYLNSAETPVRAGDPMYSEIKPFDRSVPQGRSIWAGQTSGGPLHIYITAISCLVADRLKDRAAIGGDISFHEFETSVILANLSLKQKIGMPDQCVPEHLLARLKKMPLTRHEQFHAFINLYKGPTDKNTGALLRNEFTEEECDSCWETEFENHPYTIHNLLYDYLYMEFDFEKVFRYFDHSENSDKDKYQEFIHSLLNLFSGTQHPDETILPLSDDAVPSSLAYRLAQFVQHDKYSHWVGHQIGIESFIELLEKKIGQFCDVSGIIEEWLDDETRIKARPDYTEKIREAEEKYDIAYTSQFRYFCKGKTIEPAIFSKAVENTAIWVEIAQRPDCTALMEKDPHELCRWLAIKNRSRLLTEDEWKKIFDDIIADKETFRRYEPMVKLYGNFEAADNYINAMALNDDFYEEMIHQCEEITPNEQ